MSTITIVLAVVCILLLIFIICNWNTYQTVFDLKKRVNGLEFNLEQEKSRFASLRSDVCNQVEHRWIREVPEWVKGLRFKRLIPINPPEPPTSFAQVRYDAEWCSWAESEKLRHRGNTYAFHSESFKIGSTEWIVKISRLHWSDETMWIVESARCENVPS